MLQQLPSLLSIDVNIISLSLKFFLIEFSLIWIVWFLSLNRHFLFWLKIDSLISIIVKYFKVIFLLTLFFLMFIWVCTFSCLFIWIWIFVWFTFHLISLNKNIHIIVTTCRNLLRHSPFLNEMKLLGVFVLFLPMLYHGSQFLQMFSMWLRVLWWSEFPLPIMTSTDSTTPFYIMFGPVVSSPASLDHFFQIFFHVV